MAISAALLALTVLLCSNLLGAISTLMDSAIVPDFIQMHTGAVDDAALTRFFLKVVKKYRIGKYATS